MQMNILTKKEIEDLFEYDGFNLINKNTRGMAKKGVEAGAINSKGYIHIRFKDKFYLAHRLIWVLLVGDIDENLGSRSYK